MSLLHRKGKRSSLARIIVSGLSVLALALGSVVVSAIAAEAHTGDLNATSSCDTTTGMYTITYKLTTSNTALTGSTMWRVGNSTFDGTPSSNAGMDRGPVASTGSQTITLGTTSVPGTSTKAPWAYAFTTWSDNFTKGSDGGDITLSGNCKAADKLDAKASVSVTQPTCTTGAKLVYGDIKNATWSGTPNGATGPGPYSTTATADSGHKFADSTASKLFSGTLAGPDSSLCDIPTQTVVFVQQACLPTNTASGSSPGRLTMAITTGTFVPGTVTIPDVPGVRYEVTLENGDTATIPPGLWYATLDGTASGEPYFGLLTINAYPTGTQGLEGVTEWSFSFTDPRPCGDEVIEASATSVMHQCVAGVTKVGSVTLTGDGTWTIVSDHETFAGPAGTVVTGVPSGTYDARLNGEDPLSPPSYGKTTFSFVPAAGKTLADGAQDSWTFTFTKPVDCGLAYTGVDSGLLNLLGFGGLGVLALGAGAVTMASAMRRRAA